MRISCHKARTVFDRYNIVNESDLVEPLGALNRIRLVSLGNFGIPGQAEQTDSAQVNTQPLWNQ
jgi:hypothetical protein